MGTGLFLNKFKILAAEKIEDIAASSEVEFVSCELADSTGNPKGVFSTGEDLKAKITLKFLKEPKEYYIWVGLFRGDGVYCHGSWRELKEEIVFLSYLNLPLLKGDYYFSLGVWEKDKEIPVLYKNKSAIFNMSFSGEDHGTIYLEHSWNWKLP